MEQNKMQRLLRLLMLLSGNKRYTIPQLQERFDMSERTAYRYLETIEDAGFVLNRKEGRYLLQPDTPAALSLQKLLHFSEEEVLLFYKTLSLIEGTSPVKERLLRKLHSLYDFRALAQLQDKSIIEIVGRLGEAIREKKQVVLQAYRSSNSDSIGDRTVEAFDFLSDYTAIWCYDTESASCKQFKIARMKDVEILQKPWQHKAQHRVPFMDSFCMSADAPVAQVKARLTLKAFNLLTEEYPLTEKYVQAVNGYYQLDIPVAEFNGIGRFVLGLMCDIEVTAPKAFKDFLKERIKSFPTASSWQ